ncbi:MAG: hypothetical protein FJX76_27855 [Armatimonadetes bacterium]|nr:hypothetical protein [Armatimonadota bacterium]
MRGLTLVEILISVGLLAMAILFVVSIIPTSVMSLKKAEDLQAADAYGVGLVEMARMAPPAEAETREFVVTLNRTEFHFVREVRQVEEGLIDILVTATSNARTPPLRLATRARATLGEEE